MIVDHNTDAGLEHALHLRRPLDIDDLIAFDAALPQRLAIAGMNEQPLAAAELADDCIAWYRPAALAVLDRHALDPTQLQRAGAGRSLRRIVGRAGRHTRQRLRDYKRQPLSLTDVGQNVESTLGAVLPGERLPPFQSDRLGQGLERRERLLEHALAQQRGFPLLQRFQEMSNARARLAGRDKTEP